jgi:hypothetical protein
VRAQIELILIGIGVLPILPSLVNYPMAQPANAHGATVSSAFFQLVTDTLTS